MFLMSI